MGNGGVCIWTDSNFAGSKINKQTKRKRNTRRKLQGRLIHHSNLLRDSGIDLSAELKRENYGSKCFIKRNAKRWYGR